MVKLNPLDYRIALFAVLEIEAQAALYMLDHRHDGEFSLERGDDYVFFAGDINGRNVIIATFPAGQKYGTGSAASLASQTKSFFRNLWFGLLVGVAAGLPNHGKTPPIDIRLGDVLVALPKGDSAGLISYDLGKETDNGFELLDGGRVLAKTEPVIRSAIGAIKINAPNDSTLFLPFYEDIKDEEHSFEFSIEQTFQDPGQDEDKLYSIGPDGTESEVRRAKRPDIKRTRVWYGPIGSGDKLMKNAQERDRLRDEYGIIGLEMEAAGVLSSLPVGVIRGVCDYGDSHKNKQWQPYAAAMAASYAKAILMKIGQGDEAPPAVAMSERNMGCEILCDLPSQTDRFFGREAELSSMEFLLQGTGSRRGAILCGISGSGKTQLAREYVSRNQEKLSAVMWINAASKETVDQSFSQSADRILLRSHDTPQNASRVSSRSLVLDWFSKLRSRGWLVIIDGMDNPMIAKTLFQSFDNLLSEHGAICITSTNPSAAKVCRLAQISVQYLDICSASSLVLWRALENATPDDEKVKQWARDVAKVLNRYTLGLELAGILIREGIVGMDMPPTIFETKYKELTTIDPQIWNWGKRHTMFDIFNTLYIDLVAKNNVAGHLLTLCSIYGPQEISVAFLQSLIFEGMQEIGTAQDPWSELQRLFADKMSLGLAVAKLHELFLAHKKHNIVDRSLLGFSLHGTVCQWRFATIGDQRAQWIVQALQALAKYLRSEVEDQRKREPRHSETFDVFGKFHPMTTRCLKMLEDHVSEKQLDPPGGLYAKQYYDICLHLAPLITKVGDYCLGSKLYSGAIMYAEIMSVENYDTVLLPFLWGLARCSKKSGNMAKAEECLQSAEEIAVKLYGESCDEAVTIHAELRNVRKRIDRDTDQRKRVLIASTGPKWAHHRRDVKAGSSFDKQERDAAYAYLKSAGREPQYESSSKDDSASITQLVKDLGEGLDPNDMENDSSLLFNASEQGHINTARLLLERGAVPDFGNTNETPLHAASKRGCVEMVELLVKGGADVNYMGFLGHTPLHLAAWTGQRQVAELLLRMRANPNAKANDGNTPLLLALKKKDVNIFKLLHDHCTDLDVTSSWINILLREAVGRDFPEFASLLIKKGADPKAKSRDGDTLLKMALLYNNIETVKLLLEEGVDVNGKCRFGRTSLHYATTFGDTGTVDLLLKQGADRNATDHAGQTPLHCAAAFSKADTVNLLLSNQAGPTMENDNRETKFTSAEQLLSNSMPGPQSAPDDSLETKNSLINTTDDNGQTPLMIAAIHGNSDAAQALLSNDADLTLQDLKGNTCIHLACEEGDQETVKLFLEQRIDWTVLNDYDQDALQIAEFCAHKSIVDLLRADAGLT